MVPSVVLFALGCDGVHLVVGARGSAVGRSASMGANLSSDGHTPKDVSARSVDVSVRSCDPGRGKRLPPPPPPMYNKLVDRLRDAIHTLSISGTLRSEWPW